MNFQPFSFSCTSKSKNANKNKNDEKVEYLSNFKNPLVQLNDIDDPPSPTEDNGVRYKVSNDKQTEVETFVFYETEKVEDRSNKSCNHFINKMKGRSLKRVKLIEDDEDNSYVEDHSKIFKSFGIKDVRDNEKIFERDLELQEISKNKALNNIVVSEDETVIPTDKSSKKDYKYSKSNLLKEGGFYKIIEKNYKYVGKLHSMTPLGSYCYIEVDGLEILRKAKIKNVKRISYEDYVNLKVKDKYMLTKHLETKQEISENISTVLKPNFSLKNNLCSNLIVKIIDNKLGDGFYKDEIVSVVDVYSIDECLCVSIKSSWHVKGVQSSMLEPVFPDCGEYAKIMNGVNTGRIIKCLNKNSNGLMEVEDEDEELFEVNPCDLCKYNVVF